MRAEAFALLLILAGCADQGSLDQSKTDASQTERILLLEDKVKALEHRDEALTAALAAERAAGVADHKYIESIGNMVVAVSNQVDGNAKIYNDHLRAER